MSTAQPSRRVDRPRSDVDATTIRGFREIPDGVFEERSGRAGIGRELVEGKAAAFRALLGEFRNGRLGAFPVGIYDGGRQDPAVDQNGRGREEKKQARCAAKTESEHGTIGQDRRAGCQSLRSLDGRTGHGEAGPARASLYLRFRRTSSSVSST